MHVVAVVVAGGSRPDPLTPVSGVPMLVRSVRAVLASGVADRVVIDGGERTAALLRACAGLPVDAWDPRQASVRIRAHAGQRAGDTGGDGAITASSSDLFLVHDATRPLTPPALFTAVSEAMRGGHDAVVPVLPLADTVKLVDGDGLVRGTPDRAGLRVVQTPHAVRAGAWDVHSGGLCQPALRTAHTVAGDPLAFAVRTGWDLELAGLLVEGVA